VCEREREREREREKERERERERMLVMKLKTECGYQFTSKLESMFNDIKLRRVSVNTCTCVYVCSVLA